MDRETITREIQAGPVQITMNDGSKFTIASPDSAIVDDVAAHVLHRDGDGKLRTQILALANMARIEPMETVED